MRGSRKHVLEWTSHRDFAVEFEKLVGLPEFQTSTSPMWRPRGYDDPHEVRLERDGASLMPGGREGDPWKKLASWWLAHQRGANTPNWDLAVTCKLNGKPGLALVEAKAHDAELSAGGKPLRSDASENSQANHVRIGKAIAAASDALDKAVPGVRLSRDSHYQLANRVATCWKLASLGIPALLVYLGFTGDTAMADQGAPIRDETHWDAVMKSHAAGILPDSFLDRWIPCGQAQMKMIIRYRSI